MKNIFLLLRPQQWIKNSFIFLPLFFGGHLLDVESWVASLTAFMAYCLAASSIYCFNDIWDVESDRQHPKKRLRPIACGKISKAGGYAIMAVTLMMSLCVCFAGFENTTMVKVGGIIVFYYIINLAYCTFLKKKALIDVFIIAVGFVLRVVIGGFATGIRLSHWIIIMTFLLALFLAFAKRRDDVVLYMETGVKMRSNVNRYNLAFMNQAITMVATVTMVAYIMYSVSDTVTRQFDNNYIYLTSVWVLLGLLRYLQVTIVDVKSGSPTRVLFNDRFTKLCIVGWLVTFIFIIYL